MAKIIPFPEHTPEPSDLDPDAPPSLGRRHRLHGLCLAAHMQEASSGPTSRLEHEHFPVMALVAGIIGGIAVIVGLVLLF